MIPSHNLLRAIAFAENAHRTQVENGTALPFIVHPSKAGEVLQEFHQPEEVVIAGILHDSLAEAGTNEREIKELFGESVLQLVKEVSEPDKSRKWSARKDDVIDSISTISTKAATILCAVNLRTITEIADDLEEMPQDEHGNMEGEEEFWKRFHAPKEDQEWYYFTLADALIHKLKDSPERFMVYQLLNRVLEVTRYSLQLFWQGNADGLNCNEDKLDLLEPYIGYCISEIDEGLFPATFEMAGNNEEVLADYVRNYILTHGEYNLIAILREYENLQVSRVG